MVGTTGLVGSETSVIAKRTNLFVRVSVSCDRHRFRHAVPRHLMPLSPLAPTKKFGTTGRVANATVLSLPMAPPPNTLLCSLLFYPQNCICASTSAVLRIKKPETCVSGVFVKGGQKRYFGEFLYRLEPLCILIKFAFRPS